MNKNLILSTFSGIGMLDKGFTDNGFCVVSAPEKILNGDIRDFKGIENVFGGIIGGSPCQSFSGLNRNPNGYSLEMLNEFKRVVIECKPQWFLLENVTRVPNIEINGYHVQRFNLSPKDLGFSQSRNRCFQFGSLEGLILELPEKVKFIGVSEKCLTASDGKAKERKGFREFCELQGFVQTPELENFTQTAKYRAVGNGVHLGISSVIGLAVMSATVKQNPATIYNSKLCVCSCGRIVPGRKRYFSGACRNREFTKRLKALNFAPCNETFYSGTH